MKALKVFVICAIIVSAAIGGSYLSAKIWGGKPESIEAPATLNIEQDMTIGSFGAANSIPQEVLQKVFRIADESENSKTLSSTGMSNEEIRSTAVAQLSLFAERGSKNWMKILPKFVLWIAFLMFVFFAMRRGSITAKSRKIYLALAVLVFGVVMGSDPSPMGTVKDAIALFATSRAIFPPRMIALGVFLLLVIFANKFICSWGCQLGTLQDLLFRINRNRKDNGHKLPQFRIPFVVSNGLRILFFAVFTTIAFVQSYDIFEDMDPFKLFNPAKLTTFGVAFVGVMLLLSIFTYRPWCHLFCPFGLVGWMAEKVSVFKIRVNYDKCIGCGRCAAACPTPVMDAILKQDKLTIPDCFACGTCMEVCPVKAISLSKGRREKPPVDKFGKSIDHQEA